MARSLKDPEASLTDAQMRAATLIAQGRPAADVAQTLEIPPGELADWRALPTFIAAVNAEIAEARECTRQRLRALAGDALGIVEAALREETTPAKIRLDLALKVLGLVGAGVLAQGPIGSTDPETIEAEQRSDRMFRTMTRF
jgi:hypothetical protein